MKKRKFALEAYILICIAFFYFMYRHDPALKTSTLIDCGAPVGFKLVEGQLWRFPLSMFLHSSWDHLIANCFWLYVLGLKVEAYYGSGRFILITLGIGLITNGAFLFEMVPQVGASGVLYGYFAFHLYLFFFDREHFSRSNAVIILLFLANLLYEILYPYLFPVVIDPFKESPKLIIKGHVFGFLGGLGIYLFLNEDKVKHI